MTDSRNIIWRELVKAARSGAPCPTDSDLSALAGFGHFGSASMAIHKWRKEGLISIEKLGRTKRRILIEGYWTDWTVYKPRKRYEARGRYRKPAEPMQRACLSCGQSFASGWNGERICGRCKATAEWRGNAIAI